MCPRGLPPASRSNRAAAVNAITHAPGLRRFATVLASVENRKIPLFAGQTLQHGLPAYTDRHRRTGSGIRRLAGHHPRSAGVLPCLSGSSQPTRAVGNAPTATAVNCAAVRACSLANWLMISMPSVTGVGDEGEGACAAVVEQFPFHLPALLQRNVDSRASPMLRVAQSDGNQTVRTRSPMRRWFSPMSTTARPTTV